MNKITLEYVWIDGQKPTAKMRSKTKIVDLSADLFQDISDGRINKENPLEGFVQEFNKINDTNIYNNDRIPVWGFDGSSTEQADGSNSDCVLKPVKLYLDPLRKNGLIVLCEVYNVDDTPHESNTRYGLRKMFEKHRDQKPLFGIEQEYTFMIGSRPLGFPDGGFPPPQGRYYCGVGADEVFGRDIVEEHMQICLEMGLLFEGINAEVMPGQWEFQIGTGDPLQVSDDLWIGRYMLYRVAAKYNVSATLLPKPAVGDWNGAGAHANFSTEDMRNSYEPILEAIEKLSKKHEEHIEIYGDDNHYRLSGKHETCDINTFKSGVSDRGASIRIPWQVHKKRKGYIEDRRPAANVDPYLVTSKIIETVCE